MEELKTQSELTTRLLRVYISLSLINLVLEVTLGITFCFLWHHFYQLTKNVDFASKRTRAVANCATICILVLYFGAAFIFDLIDPIMRFRQISGETNQNWQMFFDQAYSLRFLLDFIACLLILVLMHGFGRHGNGLRDSSDPSFTLQFSKSVDTSLDDPQFPEKRAKS